MYTWQRSVSSSERSERSICSGGASWRVWDAGLKIQGQCRSDQALACSAEAGGHFGTSIRNKGRSGIESGSTPRLERCRFRAAKISSSECVEASGDMMKTSFPSSSRGLTSRSRPTVQGRYFRDTTRRRWPNNRVDDGVSRLFKALYRESAVSCSSTRGKTGSQEIQ